MLNCNKLKTDLSVTLRLLKQALIEFNIIEAFTFKKPGFFIVEKKIDQMQKALHKMDLLNL